MIIVDSDCLIDFLNGKKEAIDILQQYKEEIVTTEINRFEVEIGIKRNIGDLEKERISVFLDSLDIMDSPSGWGAMAAKVMRELIVQGKMSNQNDYFIAGLMKSAGYEEIITGNIKHFSSIKGIKVIPYKSS